MGLSESDSSAGPCIVMPLIGVCMGPSESDSSAGPCIVMPFMAKGSLLDYLRKEADNLFVDSEEASNVSYYMEHLGRYLVLCVGSFLMSKKHCYKYVCK